MCGFTNPMMHGKTLTATYMAPSERSMVGFLVSMQLKWCSFAKAERRTTIGVEDDTGVSVFVSPPKHSCPFSTKAVLELVQSYCLIWNQFCVCLASQRTGSGPGKLVLTWDPLPAGLELRSTYANSDLIA